MKGWILYKHSQEILSEVDHGVNHLIAEAKLLNIDLQVYAPHQFTITSHAILLDGKPIVLPHFIIPRMGASTTYQGLSLIRQLEYQGVYSFNSAQSIQTVRDKMFSGQLLYAQGLPVPKTMLLHFPFNLDLIEQELGFPLVVKYNAGAKGVGIFLCETPTQLLDLTGFIDHATAPFLAQEFINSSYGRDLRVFILGNQVIGCMQRRALHGFKANYSLGGEVEPFTLTPEIENLALRCAAVLNLEIGGIDLLFANNSYLICEANSSPGFKGLNKALQDNIAKKIMNYIAQKMTLIEKNSLGGKEQ